MYIEELSDNLREDLKGQITQVNFGHSLEIHFQCDDWRTNDVRRHFVISCHDVVEQEVKVSSSYEIDLLSQHPLLWNHNEPHGYLYYSSEPNNRYEVLGILYEAHEHVFGGWRPLSDYANTYLGGELIDFCMGNNGLLAYGPKPIIDVYENAVADLLKTNYVPSYKPVGGFKALIFTSGFVICQSVVVTERCF